MKQIRRPLCFIFALTGFLALCSWNAQGAEKPLGKKDDGPATFGEKKFKRKTRQDFKDFEKSLEGKSPDEKKRLRAEEFKRRTAEYDAFRQENERRHRVLKETTPQENPLKPQEQQAQ